MRLADFILHDMERILAQWDAFAATRLPAALDMVSLELRDHAKQILEAIVADLRTVGRWELFTVFLLAKWLLLDWCCWKQCCAVLRGAACGPVRNELPVPCVNTV